MVSASDFKKGLTFEMDGQVYIVIDFQHVKPGKGGAFVRTTLKNLKTGRVIDNTFRSGEKIEPVRVERRKFQYLYSEGENLVCMDQETFDHINIPVELFDGKEVYLKESTEIDVLYDGENIISVEIPLFVILKLHIQNLVLKVICN